MTNKQIIIDGVKISKKDFIDDFSIELTNRNIFERDQIGDKYFEIIFAKEQECEELKKTVDDLLHKPEIEDKIFWKINNEALLGSKDAWIYKLEQTLTEIKPILEFYANSKIGEEQPDRTYKIMLSSGYIMTYDPKPAREALRKINEVEDERI